MKRDRLPPGQRLIDDFPVLHYGTVPCIDKIRWSFQVKGMIHNPVEFTFDEFFKLPASEIKADFHCVTGWSKFDLVWKGIPFKIIAEMAKPYSDVRFVSIFAEYGYSTSIPLEIAMEDDVIFAFELNGEPLTPEHGYPLRLIVPKRYAYKSAKWVRGVEFLEYDRLGFWESRGYNNSADPWREERYA